MCKFPLSGIYVKLQTIDLLDCISYYAVNCGLKIYLNKID